MRWKLTRPGEYERKYAWIPVHLLDTDEIAWLEYVQATPTIHGSTRYYSLDYKPKRPNLPCYKVEFHD